MNPSSVDFVPKKPPMTSVIKEGEIVSKLMTKQGSKDLQRAVDNAPVALIE
jgi:hypothetical protein